MSTIRLDQVSVRVPLPTGQAAKTLLADITAELAESRIAVIGANGSGKSTFLRLLNGLIEPSSGRVTVNGHDTVREVRRVRRQVGFIFTDPLSQLVMSTPLEDVELSLRRHEPNRGRRTERAWGILRERHLDHLAHQSIYDLSGGERQQVALAAVLATTPRILVSDEPTTLLDLRQRRRLRETFAGLDQQLITSTHDLDFAADAQRVLVFDQGRVVFDGPAGEGIDFYRRRMR